MDIPLPGGGGEVSEDYSPAATVVPFNPPLPLLRAPVPSSSSASTDPMPVLAFRDAASWRAAWEAAEASLFSQCEIPEPWFIVGVDEPPPSWDPVKTPKFGGCQGLGR
ncbi:uncharacterized protein LOC123400112 isoform X3 [Hordeum vulgare subsp. vulgare]|uniref:uncharacterized protein LOC123400112 isoform X3 n=1 Tax=Hordeum vulgare subsp. vulgare TaxID=112509 RepID=UPI001D1A3B58|nr:uncharacterized protein LOC123400112 isoform X3 [Hordeum vulgare subsp. vulgare]